MANFVKHSIKQQEEKLNYYYLILEDKYKQFCIDEKENIYSFLLGQIFGFYVGEQKLEASFLNSIITVLTKILQNKSYQFYEYSIENKITYTFIMNLEIIERLTSWGTAFRTAWPTNDKITVSDIIIYEFEAEYFLRALIKLYKNEFSK